MPHRGRSHSTDELYRQVVSLLDLPAEPYYIQQYLAQEQPWEEVTRPRRPPPPRVSRSQPPTTPPPQPRPACLFPLDESELAAVRSMWLHQGRRGLSLIEGLVRPVQAPPEAESISSSLSTAPSALFDTVSVSTTTTSVGTVRSPKVAPRSPSRSRTTTALSEEDESRYTLVSPDQSPLHEPAQIVLEGVLKEEKRRLSEEKPARKTESATRRRARSASESRIAWVGSFVELVGRLPNAYIPLPTDHSQPRPSHRRSFPSHDHPQPRPCRASASQEPRRSDTLINLLPLPLHPRPPHHTPIIPPIHALPRSPYRPLTPPPTPTPRIRIVPNPQFLRLKALQNRVLWGLVLVDRGECEVLRRVGIGMRNGSDEVDREGRMCSGKEAKVGVAVEGRQKRVLADMVKKEEQWVPTPWWSLKWAGM